MKLIDKISKVLNYWNQQAEIYQQNSQATIPDANLKQLEIKALIKYLPLKGKLLDVGCGNGYSDFALAKKRSNIKIIGVDYSDKMIKVANDTLKKDFPLFTNRLSFRHADILKLPFKDSVFDVAITDRCLINLVSTINQRLALHEIHRVLKPRGKYLMCEDTQEGMGQLNRLRHSVGLEPIPYRWHNLYLNEKNLSQTWNKLFRLLTVNNFTSLYYIISRVVYAKLATMNKEEPKYEHPINNIAATLPAIGDYGPLKLFVFEKR